MPIPPWPPALADVLLAIAALAVGAAYARGVARVWAADAAYWPLRTKHGRLPVWRIGLFVFGLALTTLALSGWAQALAARMLALHTAQHHLLATIGVPFLLAGVPALVFGMLLAPWRRAQLAQLGQRLQAQGWFRRTLGQPLVVWTAHVAVVWSAYVPELHGLLMRVPLLHVFHHLALLITGIAFWWLLLSPATTWLRLTRMQRTGGALAAWVQNNALSLYIAFSSVPEFPEYLTEPPLWGLSRADAQHVAGAAQYLPGEIVYLVALSVVAFGWLNELSREGPCTEEARPPVAPGMVARMRAGLLARRQRMLREEWEE